MPGNPSQGRAALIPQHGVSPKLIPLTAVKDNKYASASSPVSELTALAALAALCSPRCCERALGCYCRWVLSPYMGA